MNGKQLSEALKKGKQVYGTLIVSTSPKSADLVNKIGLDFVFIDTEHMPIDRNTLSWMCHTYGALNIAPIVRIPSPNPYEACEALDGGAAGIVAPYVETVDQVKALRGAVKLRPLKGKKVQDALDGRKELERDLTSYIETRNEGNVLIINIESKPAVENLDELIKVPQLDGVLIGPHDLSCSLDIAEQYKDSLFDKTVKTIIKKARAAGIGAGIHYFWDIEHEIDWLKCGLNMLIHSSDTVLFAKTMKNDMITIKKALGEEIDINST